MEEYLVTWQIEVDAANPTEAAEKARAIMFDSGPENTATVFIVADPRGTETKVDLAENAWLDDANVAKLQAPGNVIPDVVIQDNTVDVGPEHATDKALIEASPENFAMWKEVMAASNMDMPYWDWLDAGKPTSMPSEPEPSGTPTREYDVTWRKPTAAYAHDVVLATSAEDALMKAKARVTSRGRFKDEPYFETDTDSMDPCDWISVEGEHDDGGDAVEHVEWELPHPSAGKLMEALHEIVRLHEDFTKNGLKNSADVSPIKLAVVMNKMRSAAELAIANAIPDYELK